MKRKTFRRVARQRWPGSHIRGAGPWAVLEDWPDSRSGLAVQLFYSERLARELAASIGRAYEWEQGDAKPVRVYDLTKWRDPESRSRTPHARIALSTRTTEEGGREMREHRMRQTP
jgi:hypothetical protein